MNMNIFKILLALIIFPLILSATSHKFYVSTTNIEYVSEENSIQIISKIFVEDLEETLQKRYETDIHLGSEKETLQDVEYLKKYIQKKLKIWVDGKQATIQYIGIDYDIDIMSIYLEIENISQLKSIEIENIILMDMFEEQQNIIHFKSKQIKRSWVLDEDNTKGMLNLIKGF